MNKISIFTFLMTFSLIGNAQVLFLDTNNNDLEILAAKEEALAQGEIFISYPEPGQMFEKSKALSLIKEHKPDTLFISGHDGGGGIYGKNGDISIQDFRDLNESSPGSLDSLRTLALLGCNTANHAQVMDWKNFMPNLAFIAGYDGSAPTQKWIQGREYIKDIIANNKAIIAETDANIIKNLFESFRHMTELEATMFVDTPLCLNPDFTEDQYLFRPKAEEGERFTTFLDNDCKPKMDKFLEEIYPIYNKYLQGELEIPEDTAQGQLRDFYTHIRQNEHCYRANESLPSGNQALFLLFFKNYFKNFNEYYEPYIEDFFETVNEVYNDKEKLTQSYEKSLEADRQNIELTKKGPAYLKSLIKSEKEKIEKEMNAFPANYKTELDAFMAAGDMSTAAVEELFARMPTDFKFVYVQLPSQITLLDNAQENVSSNFEGFKTTLLEYYKSSLDNKKERIEYAFNSYEKSPIKSSEAYKNANRAQLASFASATNGMELSLLDKNDYTQQLAWVLNGAYELDGESIPFNWHDASLGFPEDPEWQTRSYLDGKKDESTPGYLTEYLNFD